MATYAELYDLRSDSSLRNKVAVAVAIKAQSLLDGGSPTSAQVTWAGEALRNPVGKAGELLNYVLAANNDATAGQITSATDAAIQTNVNAAVDAIVAGGV